MSAVGFLDSSVAACWRDRLIGTGQIERRHWRTKTAHYLAVCELLDNGTELRWETVVERVKPKGSRSTFYDVTGANATHPLIARYEAERSAHGNGGQIALAYRRASAVDQLVDETKVWAYWPFRDAWLARWRDRTTVDVRAMADSLDAVLGEWARSQVALARALDFAPPACAVEDLTLIHDGKLPALRAFSTLRDVIAEAVEGTPGQDGDAAPALATRIPRPREREADELLLGLAETVSALARRRRVMSGA